MGFSELFEGVSELLGDDEKEKEAAPKGPADGATPTKGKARRRDMDNEVVRLRLAMTKLVGLLTRIVNKAVTEAGTEKIEIAGIPLQDVQEKLDSIARLVD